MVLGPSRGRAVPPTFRFTVKAFNGITWATRRSAGKKESPNPDYLPHGLLTEFVERRAPWTPI